MSMHDKHNILMYPKPLIKRKILLAWMDDSERVALVDELHNFQYQTDCVKSGEAALDYLESNRCEFAIIDNDLPDKRGIEVIRLAQYLWDFSKNALCDHVILGCNKGSVSDIESDGLANTHVLYKPLDMLEIRTILTKANKTTHSES